MIQRDYILRLMADLANFIAKLISLHRPGFPEAYRQAVAKIEEIYGLPFDKFLLMENRLLIKDEWPQMPELCDGLAELFLHTATLATEQNELAVNQTLLQKALFLLSEAEHHGKTYSFNRMVAINDIKNKLGVD
jgi:hypothetical protein